MLMAAKIAVVCTVTLAASANSTARVTPAGSDAADRMAWWREARFGMFIHWGVYSIPAGEWGGRKHRGTSEWIMEGLHIPVSEYKKFGAEFNPVKYDPRAWARLAKEAGCGYVVITSRHHDGFCLWDSGVTDWDVAATRWKSDLLRPLADACRAEGLKFGLYYSILDWSHRDYLPRRPWNDEPLPADGPSFDRFVSYVRAQVEEVVRAYDPDILWFDGEWEATWTHEHGESLEALARSIKPEIIMNNRVGKARDGMAGLDRPGAKKLGDFGTPEQEVPAQGLPGVDWETCMTMNDSWGFKSSDHNWKSPEQLVRTLCEVASKGGNFLLNVGPTAAGEIPPESVERLRAVGAWMRSNGSAIRGTRPIPGWKARWGGGGRGTVDAGGRLYLHGFEWPSEGPLLLAGVRLPEGGTARVLTDPAAGSLKIERVESGTKVFLPEGTAADFGLMPVIQIIPSGAPEFFGVPISPGPDGVLTLAADDAEINGDRARIERSGGRPNIGFWTSASDAVSWWFTVPASVAGEFAVVLDFACNAGSEGSKFKVVLGERSLGGVVHSTGGWDRFETMRLGHASIDAGNQTLTVLPDGPVRHALMNLREVRLVPVEQGR